MVNNLPNKGSGTGEDISEEVDTIENLTEQIKLALEGKAAGGEKVFAIISVTYPEGSTCTCSKDEKTLTLSDTEGEGFFLIPEEGIWKVFVTDGENSAEQDIEIIERGQIKTVSLFYFEYIINKGKLQEGYDFTKLTASYVEADGYAQFKTKTGTSGNGAAVVAKNNAILDLTKNSLLRIELEATSTRSGTLDYFTIGIANLSDASTGHTVSEKYNLGVGTSLTRQIINLPVDTIDAGYLSLIISDNTGTVDLRIYNIWFE
jgi:hypothetical protein